MLRVAALLLVAVIVLPPSGTALAQKAAPKQTAVPTDLEGLVAWCNQAVFRRYGKRAHEYGPKTTMVVMPLEQQAMMQDLCIRSKGKSF